MACVPLPDPSQAQVPTLPWNPDWIADQTVERSMVAFRLVETQHIAATMRLVDNAAEQDLLEQMLEDSKPPLPVEAEGLHYLLAAPFRYVSPTGSRFRASNTPGLWYGADDAFCACAEIAHWRRRFLLDSAGLFNDAVSSEHSMYQAQVTGCAIDLLSPPWNEANAAWTDPVDYTQTQRLGSLARDAGHVAWLRYGSVRAPGHICAAVFQPQSLSMVTPEGRYEQWHCYATIERVTFSDGRVRYDF